MFMIIYYFYVFIIIKFKLCCIFGVKIYIVCVDGWIRRIGVFFNKMMKIGNGNGIVGLLGLRLFMIGSWFYFIKIIENFF